jgi:hypothetical protein
MKAPTPARPGSHTDPGRVRTLHPLPLHANIKLRSRLRTHARTHTHSSPPKRWSQPYRHGAKLSREPGRPSMQLRAVVAVAVAARLALGLFASTHPWMVYSAELSTAADSVQLCTFRDRMRCRAGGGGWLPNTQTRNTRASAHRPAGAVSAWCAVREAVFRRQAGFSVVPSATTWSPPGGTCWLEGADDWP